MSLKLLNLKPEYRSLEVDMVKDFYIPLLNNAIIYKRAVGYFTSSSLIEISKGISSLVKSGGKIQLVASPVLEEEDILAIKKGYENRNKIIENALFNKLSETETEFEKKSLNYLAHLIQEGILDIKIAIINNARGIGIYHEKMGIVEDEYGNLVVFSGSMNETYNAIKNNYESVDVFCSWKDEERVNLKAKTFNNIWNNCELNIETIDFPKLNEEIINKYKTSEYREDIDLENIFYAENDFIAKDESEDLLYMKKEVYNIPKVPEDVEFYDYQIEAIKNWKENNFKGIFDMATGTGKTYTGLGALVELFEHCNKHLAAIIVCPYQHLVEQWVEDLEKFNIKPIIGYSSSPQKNWKKRLRGEVLNYRINRKEKTNFFCFICTNTTFSSDYVQNQIKNIRQNRLILIDEVHNFGAQKLSYTLKKDYEYRLGLSATFNRHNDEEGTEKLLKFFEKKCIGYDIERAINEGKLTPYRYYPIIVYLTEYELDNYEVLTKEIGKNIIVSKNGKKVLNDRGKMLAIKRARIVAGATNKLSKLLFTMEDYKNKNNILVYCGSTTIDVDGRIYSSHETELENSYVNQSEFNTFEYDDKRQIDAVVSLMGNKLDMKVSKFTSEENMRERELIIDNFIKHRNCQAIIAIKCLDEGVNIPGIKTAFILASTTNPKEYIQRRGRVLRLSEGKEFAEIYDFITLPRNIENNEFLNEEIIKKDIALVKSEMKRFKEFNDLSENKFDNKDLEYKIRDLYNLYELDEEDIIYG